MIRLVALACLLAGTPDILPPGHKGVKHELVLHVEEDLAAKWRFFAAPTAGFGVTAIEPEKPFSFSAKYGTRIWAAAPEEKPPERGDDDWFTGHPVANPPVREVSSVPISSPLARVETTCVVRSIEGGKITLEVIGETRFGEDGEPLNSYVVYMMIIIATIGGIGLGVLTARRRMQQAG